MGVLSSFTVFTLFVVTNVRVYAQTTVSVVEAFESHQVVPDVIPNAPFAFVAVKYKSGVKADLGNELTPTQVKDQPTLEYEADPEDYYTVCLTDPDAPSRTKPSNREFHHWLVVNVKGSDVSSGDVISAYVGSGPPKGTGLHRYALLVYKQSGKIQPDEQKFDKKTGRGRGKFAIRKFATKYNLGDPIAGNFYQAQYDDYVPKLHKQLGF